MIVDLTARIEAKREQFAEWQLEDELEHELKALGYEFEALMERERIKRQKYKQAMAEKRARCK